MEEGKERRKKMKIIDITSWGMVVSLLLLLISLGPLSIGYLHNEQIMIFIGAVIALIALMSLIFFTLFAIALAIYEHLSSS